MAKFTVKPGSGGRIHPSFGLLAEGQTIETDEFGDLKESPDFVRVDDAPAPAPVAAPVAIAQPEKKKTAPVADKE